MTRLEHTFAKLKKEKRSAFVSFITAGDPDYETSCNILEELPINGVDIIELGIPFLDPAGDGPTIEVASKRAIENGMNLNKVLEMVKGFRKRNQETPIVLMGYYNPILHYGLEKFAKDAKQDGVDGVLIVDLPPEEDHDFKVFADQNKLDLIKLITPTSDEARIKKISSQASGFLYFVSILGITGTTSSDAEENRNHIKKIKEISDLPIIIGFGIKEPQQAKKMANIGANGVVVGSRLVSVIADGLKDNIGKDKITQNLLSKTEEFSKAISPHEPILHIDHI